MARRQGEIVPSDGANNMLLHKSPKSHWRCGICTAGSQTAFPTFKREAHNCQLLNILILGLLAGAILQWNAIWDQEKFDAWDACADTFQWDYGYVSLVQSRMQIDPDLIWAKIQACWDIMDAATAPSATTLAASNSLAPSAPVVSGDEPVEQTNLAVAVSYAATSNVAEELHAQQQFHGVPEASHIGSATEHIVDELEKHQQIHSPAVANHVLTHHQQQQQQMDSSAVADHVPTHHQQQQQQQQTEIASEGSSLYEPLNELPEPGSAMHYDHLRSQQHAKLLHQPRQPLLDADPMNDSTNEELLLMHSAPENDHHSHRHSLQEAA